MKEAYCSYEVSKLLKEKGFDEFCEKIYDSDGYLLHNDCGYINEEQSTELFCALAPTHQMACAWLRERGYHISILYQRKYKTWGRIIQELSTGIEWSIGGFDSYDRAVEASLKYALENLIEEQ